MKKVLLLFILFFFFEKDSSGQWQTIFKDSTHYWCTNVDFINKDTGFVSTANFNVGLYDGSVFRTLDGGQTWDSALFNTAIYSVQFISDSVGFAGGQDGAIYRTEDMGTTWNWIMGGPCCADLFSLYFHNADTGFYAVSDDDILRTTNGGTGWQPVFDSIGWTTYPGRSRIIMTDSNTGFLAQGTIAKTMDGGASWVNLPVPAGFNATSVYFFDLINGFAVGYEGKISKTLDGGNTWSFPDSIGPYPLSDIKFVNDSVGYIVGGFDSYNFTNTNGIIYKTINGGATWFVMDSAYFDGLLKMDFPVDSVGYAVGTGGIILKITNANSTISNVIDLADNEFGMTIYPNPVNSTLNIKNMPANDLEIYNLFGEMVLMQGRLSKNVGDFSVDISTLSSGLYLIRSGNQVRKFFKE